MRRSGLYGVRLDRTGTGSVMILSLVQRSITSGNADARALVSWALDEARSILDGIGGDIGYWTAHYIREQLDFDGELATEDARAFVDGFAGFDSILTRGK